MYIEQQIQDNVISEVVARSQRTPLEGRFTVLSYGYQAETEDESEVPEQVSKALLGGFFDTVGDNQYSIRALSVKYNPEMDGYELNARLLVEE